MRAHVQGPGDDQKLGFLKQPVTLPSMQTALCRILYDVVIKLKTKTQT